MPFLEERGGVSRCTPPDFEACEDALWAGRKGPGAAASGWGFGGCLRALVGAVNPRASAPCRPLPALAPARCSPCGLTSSGSRALEPAVFANFPGKGGGAPSSGGRPAPTSLRGRVKAWKWGGLLGAVTESASAWTPARVPLGRLAGSATRPLQHPKLGRRKRSVIAEGEERGKFSCPLLSSCCPGGVAQRQDWGLAQFVTVGGLVGVGGREAQCSGEYSPPRALLGCTLLPPTRRLRL